MEGLWPEGLLRIPGSLRSLVHGKGFNFKKPVAALLVIVRGFSDVG
jgi:hypothetical protein